MALGKYLHLQLTLASSRDDLTRRCLLRIVELHESGQPVLRFAVADMLGIALKAKAGPLTSRQEDYVRAILCRGRHAPVVSQIVNEIRSRSIETS